ncbi:MAG TPA: hypothetical protein PJ991_07095 [Kiritimatiellia bacterium]|nr:hypothetical protein [Kiritimatiellia bacterium]
MPRRNGFHLIAASGAVAFFALLLTGCAHLPENGRDSIRQRDIDSAISRAIVFYNTPYDGRINLDDIWLSQIAARVLPELKNSSFFSADPFVRFAGNPMLKLYDENFLPENLIITKAGDGRPAAFAGGAYHISSPHNREMYAPRDEVLLKALYCRETGYDAEDLDVLLATVNREGGYDDTHALVSLLILKQQGCLPAELLSPHISGLVDVIVEIQDNAELFNDLYVERVAFLFWAGAGKRVKSEWIATILDKQMDNGAWGADGSTSANLHQTALAVMSLAYYQQRKIEQPFWNLFPVN